MDRSMEEPWLREGIGRRLIGFRPHMRQLCASLCFSAFTRHCRLGLLLQMQQKRIFIQPHSDESHEATSCGIQGQSRDAVNCFQVPSFSSHLYRCITCWYHVRNKPDPLLLVSSGPFPVPLTGFQLQICVLNLCPYHWA